MLMPFNCWKKTNTENGNSRQGFTLLELIVVLVLIGLLLVVTVPTLRNNLIDDPLRSTGRKLIGYIGGVRERAIREQQSYLLYIDMDENRLWYVRESDDKNDEAEPPEKGTLHVDTSVDLANVWTKTQGSVNGGLAEIWVSRQGYLDKMLIHLGNDDGEALSLQVFPFLPDIEVLDGYHEPQ